MKNTAFIILILLSSKVSLGQKAQIIQVAFSEDFILECTAHDYRNTLAMPTSYFQNIDVSKEVTEIEAFLRTEYFKEFDLDLDSKKALTSTEKYTQMEETTSAGNEIISKSSYSIAENYKLSCLPQEEVPSSHQKLQSIFKEHDYLIWVNIYPVNRITVASSSVPMESANSMTQKAVARVIIKNMETNEDFERRIISYTKVSDFDFEKYCTPKADPKLAEAVARQSLKDLKSVLEKKSTKQAKKTNKWLAENSN